MFYPFSSQPNGSFNTWLESAVFTFDRWLRQRQGVYEYSSHPSCILRMQRAQAEHALTLSDGTLIKPGDAILNLHLWNEQVPSLGESRASVAWGQQMKRAVQISLIELARHLADNDELKAVVAVRADIRLGTAAQSTQLIRMAYRYGFEPVTQDATEDGALHRFGENIYVLMLVLATNPIAVGSPVLRRDHTLVYLSRKSLEQRYVSTIESLLLEPARLC